MATIATLVTAYHGTKPGQLQRALDSIAAQTLPADDIVIVLDGPVPEGVDEVVRGFVDKHKSARCLRLEENLGSGPASQAGLELIDAEFTARLDSDDVAKPQRFAAQAEFLRVHPEVAAVGTAVEEFEREPGDTGKIRALPEDPKRYARINSPLSNPSTMMRTGAVKEVGGYNDVHFMEDYDLWARLIAAGWELRNLPEALTYFQMSDSQFARRTGAEMFAAERTMQRNLVEYGLISRPRALANLAVRSLYRALPKQLLRRVYRVLFHRSG